MSCTDAVCIEGHQSRFPPNHHCTFQAYCWCCKRSHQKHPSMSEVVNVNSRKWVLVSPIYAGAKCMEWKHLEAEKQGKPIQSSFDTLHIMWTYWTVRYILLHSYYSHTSFYFELTRQYISNKVFIYVNTVGSRYLACNIKTKLRWHSTKSSSIIGGCSCALWNMAVVYNPDSIGCTRFAAPMCIVWRMW